MRRRAAPCSPAEEKQTDSVPNLAHRSSAAGLSDRPDTLPRRHSPEALPRGDLAAISGNGAGLRRDDRPVRCHPKSMMRVRWDRRERDRVRRRRGGRQDGGRTARRERTRHPLQRPDRAAPSLRAVPSCRAAPRDGSTAWTIEQVCRPGWVCTWYSPNPSLLISAQDEARGTWFHVNPEGLAGASAAGDCRFRPDSPVRLRPNRATRATIAFPESDRPDRPRAGDAYATASVVSPRLADGCFSPAMHKPSRSRPAASAALLLHYGVGRPPARSDRPALAVRVIGLRGNEWRISSDPPPLRRDRFQSSAAR